MAAVVVLAAFLAVQPAEAHRFEKTATQLKIDAAKNFEATLKLDLDRLALGVDPDADQEQVLAVLRTMPDSEFKATEDGLRNLLMRRLRIRVDGKPVPYEVSFPGQRPREGATDIFGSEARLVGRLPEGGEDIVFFASRAFPAIELTFINEGTGKKAFHLCLPGEECPKIKLNTGASETGLAEFIVIGFKHIVPLGGDHILFVLALFLGGRDLKTLLIQTGVFTIAHSATLALSTFGVVSLSPRFVEPLIALSIAIVGLENVFRPGAVSRSRVAVVFVFGLLHGLGFAGVLAETPLAEGQRLGALILFNVGVELGQVTVIALAFLLSLPFKDPDRYRAWVQRPLSLALSAVGLVWTLLRAAS
jgi:hydrogenase/urease accessory protein HupE